MAMLPNLKTVYVVEGREVAYEWLAVDRSFVPRAPYNKGYAAVVRGKWNQMMAPEISAGKAPELIFKIVERENLDERSVERVESSGIKILDDNPAPERVVMMGGWLLDMRLLWSIDASPIGFENAYLWLCIYRSLAATNRIQERVNFNFMYDRFWSLSLSFLSISRTISSSNLYITFCFLVVLLENS